MNQPETLPPLFDAIRAAIATPEPADIGPQMRRDAKPIGALQKAVEAVFAGRRLSEPKRELIWAAALLWHDHLDEAHEIVQNGASGDPAFLHGIMHRREPDYSNAKYWFNRVGRHPVFQKIAASVAKLPGVARTRIEELLVPGGAWRPFAFIDLCEETALKPAADADQKLLHEIQRAEFEALLEHICLAP